MNTIKIPNNSIIEDFKEHLDLDLNQRILFTAPFGAGKSTFINEFQEGHNKEYRFIRLYPVNYAVSANEDIFELIKYDILHELTEKFPKNIDFEKDDFPLKLRSYMFLRYQMDKKALVTGLLNVGGEIGKPLSSLVKVLWNTYDEFKAYSNELKIDEIKQIEDFFKEVEEAVGTPKEMNSLSDIIRGLVDQLKCEILTNQEDVEEESQKRKYKTVLVIDDLDRLDPDHIFRLFNIFSAHTHAINGDNKFGFDKVVFVCDIENIQRIYAHKYGKGVDFSGYMDKFYSLKPFEFDHKEHLSNQLKEIIKQYQFINTDSQFVKGNYFEDLLIGLLKVFVGERIVNLRSLLQVRNSEFYLEEKPTSNLRNLVLPGLITLKILKEIVGGLPILEQNLILIANNYRNNYTIISGYSHKHKYNLTLQEYKAIVGAFIVFQNENMVDSKGIVYNSETKKVYFNNLNVSISYSEQRSNYTNLVYIIDVYEGNCTEIADKSGINEVELSIPNLILHAFNYLKENHEL